MAIGEMSGGGSQRQLIGILQRLDRNRFVPQLYVVSAGGELMSEVPADVPVHCFQARRAPPRWTYPGQAHRARVRDLAAVRIGRAEGPFAQLRGVARAERVGADGVGPQDPCAVGRPQPGGEGAICMRGEATIARAQRPEIRIPHRPGLTALFRSVAAATAKINVPLVSPAGGGKVHARPPITLIRPGAFRCRRR